MLQYTAAEVANTQTQEPNNLMTNRAIPGQSPRDLGQVWTGQGSELDKKRAPALRVLSRTPTCLARIRSGLPVRSA